MLSWMTMTELAQEAKRLSGAYPTNDTRKSTQNDSKCESRSNDKSKNVETDKGNSRFTGRMFG